MQWKDTHRVWGKETGRPGCTSKESAFIDHQLSPCKGDMDRKGKSKQLFSRQKHTNFSKTRQLPFPVTTDTAQSSPGHSKMRMGMSLYSMQ